jgi:hypothetical protein
MNTTKPPTFFVSDTGGCIGRFWWVNTIQRPPEWVACAYPFPLWGTSHWYGPALSSAPVAVAGTPALDTP